MIDINKLEAHARKVGSAIGHDLPPGIGFVLWLFEFGDDGWATYISNATRETMVDALEELLSKLKMSQSKEPKS